MTDDRLVRRRKGPVSAKEKELFLQLLADGWSVRTACEKIGRSRFTMQSLRRNNEEFAEKWAQAFDESTEAIEEGLERRSREGWPDETIHYDAEGNVTGRTVRHQWTPAPSIFMLKARKPEVYRDNATVQVTGADGGAIQVEGYSPPTLAEIVRLAVELGVAGVIEGEASEDAIIELEEGKE